MWIIKTAVSCSDASLLACEYGAKKRRWGAAGNTLLSLPWEEVHSTALMSASDVPRRQAVSGG